MTPQSRSFVLPIVVILFIFIFIYLFAKILGPIPLSINAVTTTKTDMFTATGEGEATAIPDTAQFTLGVTKQAATVQEAQQQANQVASAIIDGLKKMGIKEENIQTTNYSVTPNYDFSTSSQTITGYSVSQNIQVEVTPIEKANEAIDMAVGQGANMTGGITFVLDDKKQLELENKARKQAIDAAKQKAQSIADAAGIKLGRIINVQESNAMPRPVFMDRSAVAMEAKEEAAPTNLQPGENTVNLTVTLYYETL